MLLLLLLFACIFFLLSLAPLAEVSSLESESARLSSLESSFWHEYSAYSLSSSELVEEQSCIQDLIRSSAESLDRLKRTNVFDDAFHISHDGHFATINGFRLGRLPSQPVEWAEISAALGQALLLLATMARQSDYKFQKCVPRAFFFSKASAMRMRLLQTTAVS